MRSLFRYSLVTVLYGYRGFGGTITSLFNPEYGDNIFRRITGTHNILQHGFLTVKYA